MPKKDEKRIRPVVVEEVGEEEAPPKMESEPDLQKKAEEMIGELEKSNENPEKKKKVSNSKTNFKLILIVTVLTALIVGFVSGGVYVYFSGLTNLNQTSKPQPTPTPLEVEQTPSPIPTPLASPKAENIDLSVYKISVLNGSGKIGEAGKVRDLLKADGFTVSSVGNASRYDYTDTIIQVTKDVPNSVISSIKKSLSDSYSVKEGDTLPSTSKYEVVITVGSK
jgi:hypothetical protein